jgi:hypothetical protein
MGHATTSVSAAGHLFDVATAVGVAVIRLCESVGDVLRALRRRC